MALDLSHLLRKPAGQATKPQALPMGDYSGIIKSFEYGDNNQNKTPYVRFQLGLLDWPEAVPQDERGQNGPDGEFHPTDLSKRSLRRDYYLTEDAFWRLDELIKACGISPDGSNYEELIPRLVGTRVTVEVQQYVNQKTSEIGNQVGRLISQG